MIIEQLWSLLGIVIALTAYIATVRRRILDKTKEQEADRDKLFKYAACLMWADVPLVISGFLITAHNLCLIANLSPYPWVGWLGILAFSFALIVLAIFHGIEWRKSLKKNL